MTGAEMGDFQRPSSALASPPGQAPDTRERLAAALAKHSLAAYTGSDSLCACRNLWRTNESHREHLADALLPVVAALVREGAAEALDEVARVLRKSARDLAGEHRTVAEGCAAIVTAHASDARATALRAPSSRGEASR